MQMRKEMLYNKIRNGLVLSIFIGITVFSDSCNLNDKWDGYYGNTPERAGENILTLLAANENYSRFYNVVKEYGFDDLLTRNQYLTVFVPVNQAFEGIPEYSQEEWNHIIGFHIIYANLYSRDFADLDLMTTIGKYLNLESLGNNEFNISGSGINMENVDNYCQNGVIHEIDKLLVPKPNLYEYIMQLDSSYSILQNFLLSMDIRSIDYENSVRIGVNDNGDAVYDTVWKTENYYLDHIADLNDETDAFTGFLPQNADVIDALNSISEYFGDINEMNQEEFNQLLFIAFNGIFVKDEYTRDNLPDTLLSVTGKKIDKSTLSFDQADLEVSNGIIHLLDGMTVPKSYFLLPITIECDQKENRRVSNTAYVIEQLSDTRATNGSYVWYGCQFVGDYLEFTVEMVLKTTYWFTWTGPKQGPSHYQLFIKDDNTGEFINIGPPVNNWTKTAWKPVVSGTYTFEEYGTKTIRFVIVDERPLVGYNSIYVDYIKLTPDEIYEP
jgi:uncharacterized surface protein with fasciclin (FAS1) repeats